MFFFSACDLFSICDFDAVPLNFDLVDFDFDFVDFDVDYDFEYGVDVYFDFVDFAFGVFDINLGLDSVFVCFGLFGMNVRESWLPEASHAGESKHILVRGGTNLRVGHVWPALRVF